MGNCTSLSDTATGSVKTTTRAEDGVLEAALLCNSKMVTGSNVSVYFALQLNNSYHLNVKTCLRWTI